MNKRNNLRVIPNKDSFIKITDHTDREWHFKVPSALQGMKMLKNSKDLIIGLAKLSSGDPSDILKTATQSGPEVLSLFGVILGISWHSAEYDLETKNIKTFDDINEYGEAVFEELHDADFSLEDIVLMGVAVGKVWWDKNQIQQEAMDRLGFSKLMKEQKSLSN